MSVILKTDIDAVLLAIQARIVAFTGLPPELVRIFDPDEVEEHPQADGYFCIWEDNETPDQSNFDGGGRDVVWQTSRIGIAALSRTTLDEPGNALSWLTDPALGQISLRRLVGESLIGRVMTDDGTANGNWLTICPLAPGPIQKARRVRRDKAWGESRVGIVAIYEANLVQR